MRIDRMLTIIIMLLNRDKVTARELAEKFEVSIRTIYRDIDAINVAGIPVISFSGNNGGFGIIDNYKIDHKLLSLKDMLTILSALKGINLTLENRELENAIDKITSLVPKEKSNLLQSRYDQIVIDILPLGYTKRERSKIKTIHQAISRNQLLSMEYSNATGEKNTRTLEPMTLLFKGYAWYLFAFCRKRSDFRLFRLSRIARQQILDETFNRKEGSYEEYIWSTGESSAIVDILLKFSPNARVKVEDYFFEEDISFLENGEIMVRMSIPEENWVYSMILGYGEDVEVIEPEHIKKIIKEKAEKILKIYES